LGDENNIAQQPYGDMWISAKRSSSACEGTIGLRGSMSRTGNPYDNASVETFISLQDV